MSIRERFFNLLVEQNISQKQAAGELKINPGTITQYKQGNYPGDNAKLERKIEGWLNVHERRQQAAIIKHVNTRYYTRMYDAIATARAKKTMAFVVSDEGTGKTHTIDQYAENNPRTIVIHGDKTLTNKGVIRKIAKRCNIFENSLEDAKDKLIEHLKANDYLIIYEEADRMDTSILDITRRVIFDQGKTPVVFTGIRTLLLNVFLNTADHRQLQRRIGVYLDCKNERFSMKEAREMVATITQNLDDEFTAYMHGISNRNIGDFKNLVEQVFKNAKMDVSKINKELINYSREELFSTATAIRELAS